MSAASGADLSRSSSLRVACAGAQKEAEHISARETERQAEDANIARLRALRLAKEASDKAAGLSRKRSKTRS